MIRCCGCNQEWDFDRAWALQGRMGFGVTGTAEAAVVTHCPACLLHACIRELEKELKAADRAKIALPLESESAPEPTKGE